MLGSKQISWKTKKQPKISRSFADTKYRSFDTLFSELQWLKYMLSDLGIDHPQTITVYYEGQVAIHIAENPNFHECTKYIEGLGMGGGRKKIQFGFISGKKGESKGNYI